MTGEQTDYGISTGYLSKSVLFLVVMALNIDLTRIRFRRNDANELPALFFLFLKKISRNKYGTGSVPQRTEVSTRTK